MGAALYIALEREIPNVDTMIDGKMLCKAEAQLADAAERLGVRPLMTFFSVGDDELADLLGDVPDGGDSPAEQWFSAEDGLRTVDALLGSPDASPEARAATDDLLGCQRVLQEAKKHGVRWRLAIDF